MLDRRLTNTTQQGTFFGGVMYLAFRRLHIVDDFGLCCCVCVTYFERYLTPLCGESSNNPLVIVKYLAFVLGGF